jgi:hypothetical protein
MALRTIARAATSADRRILILPFFVSDRT